MTLTTLFDQVAARQAPRPSRLKDVRTSLRYLARALGAEAPESCAAEVLQAPDWKARLNTYLAALEPPPSGHTVRNTRNNLSWLARQAQALGLLQAPAAPAIRAWWEAYRAARGLRLRPDTLANGERRLGGYLGYLLVEEAPPVAAVEELFAVARLDRFVRWHGRRWGVRVTRLGVQTAKLLRHLAAYAQSPAAQGLKDYCRDLPEPAPVHDKARQWFTLAELEAVGADLWARAQRPVVRERGLARPGLYRALEAGRALMLRLLVRVPLRQRNLRELCLGRHLYRDPQGHWQLALIGEDLKVGTRRGQVNAFRLDLSAHAPELIPHLEAYLARFRPLLPHADADPHLWLTRGGRPYTVHAVHAELRAAVDRRLGRHFYPHLIRTVWATEFINATGDFTTAAYMLNDRVETVLRRYQALLDRDLQAKARAFLRQALPPAAPGSGRSATREGRAPGWGPSEAAGDTGA